MTNTNAPPVTENAEDQPTQQPHYPRRWHNDHGPSGGFFRVVGTTVVGAGAGIFFRRFILRTWSRAPVVIGASLGFGFGIMGAICRSHHAHERGYYGEGSWWRRAHCNPIYVPSGPGPHHTYAEDGSEISRTGCHWGRSHHWSPAHHYHYHRWGGCRGYQYSPPAQIEYNDQSAASGAAKPNDSGCRRCGSPKPDQAKDTEVHVGTQESTRTPSAPPINSDRPTRAERPKIIISSQPAAVVNDHEEVQPKRRTGPPEATYSHMDSVVVDRTTIERTTDGLPTVRTTKATAEKLQQTAAQDYQEVFPSASKQQPRTNQRVATNNTGVIDGRDTRVEQVPHSSRQEVSRVVPQQPTTAMTSPDRVRDNFMNEGREARVHPVGNVSRLQVTDSAPQRPHGIYPDLNNVRA